MRKAMQSEGWSVFFRGHSPTGRCQRHTAQRKLGEFDKGIRRYMKNKLHAVETNVLVRETTQADRWKMPAY
jgi:hypothetical protein